MTDFDTNTAATTKPLIEDWIRDTTEQLKRAMDVGDTPEAARLMGQLAEVYADVATHLGQLTSPSAAAVTSKARELADAATRAARDMKENCQ